MKLMGTSGKENELERWRSSLPLKPVLLSKGELSFIAIFNILGMEHFLFVIKILK